MARVARIIIPEIPYHLTQRGNYRQIIFREEEDREKYLSWLKEYSEKCGLKIWAYCLMDNHVHFIVVPERLDSMSRTFSQVHMRYSQYFNRKMGQNGHLWQGRFYSCGLDEGHLYTGIRYVERNPVRAGLVKQAEDYRWSSAFAHVKGVSTPILSDDIPLIKEIFDWREYLSTSNEETMLKKIRSHTGTGQPLGDETFVIRLERLLGRTLRQKSVGRPKKGK